MHLLTLSNCNSVMALVITCFSLCLFFTHAECGYCRRQCWCYVSHCYGHMEPQLWLSAAPPGTPSPASSPPDNKKPALRCAHGGTRCVLWPWFDLGAISILWSGSTQTGASDFCCDYPDSLSSPNVTWIESIVASFRDDETERLGSFIFISLLIIGRICAIPDGGWK